MAILVLQFRHRNSGGAREFAVVLIDIHVHGISGGRDFPDEDGC
jgi:hypothetical protein